MRRAFATFGDQDEKRQWVRLTVEKLTFSVMSEVRKILVSDDYLTGKED